MSFGPDFPAPGGPDGPRRPDRPAMHEGRVGTGKPSPLLITIIVVALLVAAFVFFANFYTDILWYSQLGFAEVFWTEILTKAAIFVVGFILMAVPVWFSLHSAYKHRPVYAPDTTTDSLYRYQRQLEPVRRLMMIGVPVALGIFSASALASQWKEVLLFLNQVEFGKTDPEFGLDLSFYINTLPVLSLAVGYLISVVLIAGIAGILTHYLYGGVRVEERGGIKFSRAVQVHAGIAAALFLILQGVTFFLDRYATLTNQTGRVAGALYTDVHAVIPTKTILAIAAIIVAILFIVGAAMGRWKLPAVGAAMMVVTAIVAGGLYPYIVQEYNVRPSEKTLEKEYIERNINMTRDAYGLKDVQMQPYRAEVNTKQNALAKDSATTTNIRLLDPNLVSDAFSQLQQFRPYYSFASTLNVDRYEVDGNVQDTVIAVREVSVDPNDSWINQHVTYTHGYGVVAAYGAKVGEGGRPDFMLEGIPSTGVLGDDSTYEPRIYFGESSPRYSVVGGPSEGWEPRELDRPQDQSDGAGDAKTTFQGDGGPKVGDFFNRLVYSIKFGSTDLLLSGDVNSESQILYDRTPRERVEKVAPYLRVDSNAYPAIIDGRVKWIVDAYTTSNEYPYSQSQRLDSAVTDSLTGQQTAAALSGQVNYLRNSVKATVDAYDGSVDLYAWEPDEPILKAWQKVFPTSIKPYSEMSAQLMDHVRYPEDQFKVQRELLSHYHVTNPIDFYESNDAWSVPNDPTVANANVKQPPYYLSLRMPDQKEETFSLTSTFIPASAASGAQRNVLYGFLSAEADAGTGKAGEKAPGYGKLRLLELPRSTSVPGPGQAQQNFDSNTTVSRELNLLRTGASTVLNGNLLSLPVGGGILYVQPVYVKSTGQTSYPTLRKVLVSFGDRVGFAGTLSEALDDLFQGSSGAVTTEGDGTPGDGGTTTPPAEADAATRLKQALAEADAAIKAGQTALAAGDFAKYGEEQKKLQAALSKAIAADDEISGAAATPSDAAQPSESAPASESAAPASNG